MKRFTATEKWDDSWFRKLTPELKCFWAFICERCDCAGVWKVDLEAAEFFIGAKLDLNTLSVAFGNRIRILSEEKWWITRFVEFQYGRLSRECKPHGPIFKTLEHHGISLESLGGAFVESKSEAQNHETISVPLANPSERVQDIDKEKDKEKEGECRGGPTLDGVLTEASLRAITPECATSYFDSMETCGWIDSQHRPVRDWRAGLRKWSATWRANEQKERNHGNGRSPEKPQAPLPVFTAPRRGA